VFMLAVYAIAQQTNFAVTTLTSGSQVIGTLLPTSSANAYNIDLYSIFVPENTSSLNIKFSNTNTATCTYVHLFGRTGGLPCSYHDYSTSDGYICASTYDPQNGVGSSPVNDFSYPGDDDDLYAFAVDQSQYFGVGRYYSSENAETCSYTIQVVANATCGVGQVVIYSSSSGQYCVSYVVASIGMAMSINETTVYKINVAEGTGMIMMVVNSTSSSGNFYGANYAAYVSSGDSVCNNPGGSSQGNYYIYTIYCYTPRTGSFFLSVVDTDFNGTVTITTTVCAAGFGGFNCTYPATELNLTALATGFTIFLPYVSDVVGYYTAYYYIDVNATMSNTIIVTGTSIVGSGYGYIRRSGYPTYSSSSGYEDSSEYDSYPSSFPITSFEYAVAGRIYLGFDCTSSTGCNITVAQFVPPVVTTGSSASVTTGIQVTTGAAVTTGMNPTTAAVTSARGLTTMGLTTMSPTTGAFTSRAVTSAAITSSRITSGMQASSSAKVLPVFGAVCLVVLSLLF